MIPYRHLLAVLALTAVGCSSSGTTDDSASTGSDVVTTSAQSLVQCTSKDGKVTAALTLGADGQLTWQHGADKFTTPLIDIDPNAAAERFEGYNLWQTDGRIITVDFTTFEVGEENAAVACDPSTFKIDRTALDALLGAKGAATSKSVTLANCTGPSDPTDIVVSPAISGKGALITGTLSSGQGELRFFANAVNTAGGPTTFTGLGNSEVLVNGKWQVTQLTTWSLSATTCSLVGIGQAQTFVSH